MIQVPENNSQDTDQFNRVLMPHHQDFKAKNMDSLCPNTSDHPKLSSHDSMQAKIGDSAPCWRLPVKSDTTFKAPEVSTLFCEKLDKMTNLQNFIQPVNTSEVQPDQNTNIQKLTSKEKNVDGQNGQAT